MAPGLGRLFRGQELTQFPLQVASPHRHIFRGDTGTHLPHTAVPETGAQWKVCGVFHLPPPLSSLLPKVLNVPLQLRERGILPLSPLEEGPLRGPGKSFSTSMSLGGK